MKKSHRREIFLARVVFGIFLVLVAAVIALSVMLISSHLRDDGGSNDKEAVVSDDKKNSVEPSEIKEGIYEAPTESEETGEQNGSEGTESTESNYRWTTTRVNFRQTPSTTEDNLIQSLDTDTKVEWISESDGWAKVKYNDYEGYISAEYLTATDPNGQSDDQSQGTDAGDDQDSSDNQTTYHSPDHDKANNIVVVIDPGHQASGDSAKEANGPGSSTMKARVTGGATGVATGVPEYQLNLDISNLLKSELEDRGYQVKMTRTTNDVNISNKERAEYASEVNADIAVRIHANSVDSSSVRGALTVSPSDQNPYVASLADESMKLSEYILTAYCAATGFQNKGCTKNDGMTGINWSTVPVTILELGFMSNREEDEQMQKKSMQRKMARGIADGIDAYFDRSDSRKEQRKQ